MTRLKKIFLFTVFILTAVFSAYAQNNVTGLWLMPDDKPGNPPSAIVYMYIYEGVLGFIGISLPFLPVTENNLPAGVTIPDSNTVIPNIPRR